MVGTARQLDGAPHHTNASFNTITKPLAVLEPGLFFMGAALLGLVTGLGQRTLCHPQAPRQAFVGRREYPLVPGQHLRGMPEALAMAVQDLGQQLFIGRIAGRDELPVTNEAPLHFGIVDLMPKFRLPRAGFAAANDLGMGFTETDHFLLGGE